MADNVTINPGTGGATIATDDLGAGVQVQRVKIGYGPDGSYQDVTTTTALPVNGMTGEWRDEMTALPGAAGSSWATPTITGSALVAVDGNAAGVAAPPATATAAAPAPGVNTRATTGPGPASATASAAPPVVTARARVTVPSATATATVGVRRVYRGRDISVTGSLEPSTWTGSITDSPWSADLSLSVWTGELLPA